MPSPFSYDVATETANSVANTNVLEVEIENSSIGRRPTETQVTYADPVGFAGPGGSQGTLQIWFSPDLTAGEETTLDGVIAAHTGVEPAEEVQQTEAVVYADLGTANGVATLDGSGQIPAAQIPATARPNIFSVADEAARLALSPSKGDEAIQADDSSQWVYDGSAWVERPAPNLTGYQLTSEKDQNGGYVGRGSGGEASVVDLGVSGVLTTGLNFDSHDITNLGTVNGRDVSVDGSKLDGIEAGATADQTAAEVVFSPAGDLTSTNVQAALVEVRDDTDTKLSAKADTTALSAYQLTSEKDQNTGYAGLDGSGQISGAAHGTQSGGGLHADATTGAAGFMSAADKTKLDGIASGATVDANTVKVSANDTTPSELLAKFLAGTGITLTETNDGGNEQIEISASVSMINDIAASAYLASGLALNSGSFADLALTSQYVGAGGELTIGASGITVNTTGAYLVFGFVTIDQTTGNNRTTGNMRVVRNGTLIPGMYGALYSRNFGDGQNTASAAQFLSLTAGDVIALQGKRDEAARTLETTGGGLVVLSLKGPKGDVGPSGSGTVSLKDGGTTVSGGPHSTLDFVGNVTVTDNGGGEAQVSVASSVFGAEVQFAESLTTSSTSSTNTNGVQVLSMTTGNLPSGTYRIGWYGELSFDGIYEDQPGFVVRNESGPTEYARENPVVQVFGGSPVQSVSGFTHVALSGVQTITLRLYSTNSVDTATIGRRRLEIWRIS